MLWYCVASRLISSYAQHRDLHLGNICVREGEHNLDEQLRTSRKIGYSRLRVTIIDYTLSRADMDTESNNSHDPSDIAYLDLDKDPALFEGQGEYQYDVYR